MNASIQNRIDSVIERIKSERRTITVTTKEDAEKYGVRLGDTINLYAAPEVIGNAQQGMDDFIGRIFHIELTNNSKC